MRILYLATLTAMLVACAPDKDVQRSSNASTSETADGYDDVMPANAGNSSDYDLSPVKAKAVGFTPAQCVDHGGKYLSGKVPQCVCRDSETINPFKEFCADPVGGQAGECLSSDGKMMAGTEGFGMCRCPNDRLLDPVSGRCRTLSVYEPDSSSTNQ